MATTTTTYSLVRQFLPDVWEAALDYAQQNFVMGNLVTVFADMAGMQGRMVTENEAGTVNTNLAETQDLTPQAFNRRLLASLTPAEHGMQYMVTDRRVASDDESVLADIAQEIGYAMGKKVEQDLLGDFSSFTGGSVGSAGSGMTWQLIFDGRARLAAAGIPGPYNVVLHEYQWLDLTTSVNIANTANPSSLTVRDDIQSNYYMGSMGDLNFYVTGLMTIDGLDDATGAIFSNSALALDWRRGIRIEPQRDASMRATEINASMIYAHGAWRASRGVKVISDATAPGTAVTTNSNLSITGMVDDNTQTAPSQVGIFTFVVVNVGSTIATNIRIDFTIPSNWTYVSNSPSQGLYDSTLKQWELGSLAVGGSAIVTLNYTAATAGSVSFVGTIGAVTPSDNVSGNNTATVAVVIS